jgi:p-aminobenzoyl-glutamate transporter AbgT
MNESSPPRIQPVVVAASVPLGEQPEDRLPIYGVSAAMEAILRQPRRVMFQLRQSASSRLIAAMVLLALLCALVYGLVVGTFSGAEQLWAAPAKIAGGMLVCAAICLPSLYIFSCLSGSQARLIEVIGLVAGLLLLMTLLLIGFAPSRSQAAAARGARHETIR